MATRTYRSHCQLGIGGLCWRCAAVASNKRVLGWSVAGAPWSLRSLEHERKGIFRYHRVGVAKGHAG